MAYDEDDIEDQAYDLEIIPQFSLTVIDEVDETGPVVNLLVSLPEVTDDRPAALSLLYGLAIMSLNDDGTIERRAAELSQAQEITQKVAVESIKLLLMEALSTDQL